MRKIILAATAVLLTVTLACRDKKTREVGGVTDTAVAPAPAPTPEASDTATGASDFTFGQRQEFAASIRRQLAGIDQEIAQLASQAKSKGGAVSDRALAKIRANREAVTKSLSRIETATEASWNQVKEATNGALDTLSESIQSAQPK